MPFPAGRLDETDTADRPAISRLTIRDADSGEALWPRLRKAVKGLLRIHGFTLVEIEEITEEREQ